MSAPQIASLPPFFTLSDGMLIRVTAVDATTGNVVSGVVVSGVSFSVDPVEAPVVGKEGPFSPQFTLGDMTA